MRISVTQLETFQACQVKFDYRHVRRLKPNVDKPSAALLVGRLVADALEVGLLSETHRETAAGYIRARVGQDLQTKALSCLSVMPQTVWGIEGISEDKLEVHLGQHVLVGKPDLWHVEYAPPFNEEDHPTEPVGVRLVEFKTCGDPKSKAARKLESYETWGVQAVRYCALLREQYDWLRDLPFYRQHILLSWHEKATASYVGRSVLVSERAMDASLSEMESIADEADLIFQYDDLLPYPQHHFSMACDWCEFGPICQAHLRSGDPEYVIETAYHGELER